MVIKNDVRWLKESEAKSNSHLEHDTKTNVLDKNEVGYLEIRDQKSKQTDKRVKPRSESVRQNE